MRLLEKIRRPALSALLSVALVLVQTPFMPIRPGATPGPWTVPTANAAGLLADQSPSPWAPNGTVRTVEPGPNGSVYVGGSFTRIAPYTGTCVRMSKSTGAITTTVAPVVGTVRTIAADGSGGSYIGGSFSSVGGTPRPYLAHLLSDGSLDPGFHPDLDGMVLSIARVGSTLYIGGAFTTIDGLPRTRIAALSLSGTPTPWAPSCDGNVFTIAPSGSTLYVGGQFTSIGDAPRNRIAQLDISGATTGTATSWDPNANNTVSAIAVTASTVLAGGGFTTIGGASRSRVAEINSAGSATAWNPNANNTVFGITLNGSTAYIAGSFTQIGGASRGLVAEVDISGTTTGTATAWNPNAQSGYARGVAKSGSSVFIYGSFVYVGGSPHSCIAQVDTSGTVSSWNPNVNDLVYAMDVGGSDAVVAGNLTSVGGVQRNHLAQLDASGAPTTWDPNADSDVYDIVAAGSKVYACGDFTSIGGQTRPYLAQLDASGMTTGAATVWSPNPDMSVLTLALSGSTLYAGGVFNTIGGQDRLHIAQLDVSGVTTGAATVWNPSADHYVWAIQPVGSTAYVGGDFTTIGGAARHCIAQLDASGVTTGTATAWNPNAGDRVQALALDGTKLYAGGWSSSNGGINDSTLVQFDISTPGTGSATAWDPKVAGSVYSLSVSNGHLFAAGNIVSASGVGLAGVAAFDPSIGGSPMLWSPNPSGGAAYSVLAQGTSVYVGGQFVLLSGVDHMSPDGTRYLAKVSFSPAPSTSIAISPTTADGSSGWYSTVPTVTLQPDIAATTRYRWDDTGSWTTYSAPFSALEGSHTLAVYSENAEGGAEPIKHVSLAVDPAGFSADVVLNDGAVVATSTAVSIDTSVQVPVTLMRVNADGSYTDWEVYDAHKQVYLPPVDGTRVVDVQLRDINGHTVTRSDSIMLDTHAPVAPAAPVATPLLGQIDVSWTNPPDSDFSRVRVLRSTSTLASGPGGDASHTVVYDGTGTGFSDAGLANGTLYVYTLFAEDTHGNWSPAASVASIAGGLFLRPTTLVLTGSSSVVTYPGLATVTGTLSAGGAPLAGQTVELWTSANGNTWARVATAKNVTGGSYTATAALWVTSYVQLRYAGSYPFQPNSTSAVRQVKVRALLGTPVITPSAPVHGRVCTVSGTIRPAHPSRAAVVLVLQRNVRGAWTTYRSLTAYAAAGSTSYRLSAVLPSAGSWRVRATHVDVGHAASSSAVRSFTVR